VAEKPKQLRTSLPLYEAPQDTRRRAWVETARVTQLVERQIVTELGRHGFTLPQFDVVATLRFGEGVTQQELAERLLVTKGNVTGVLDRLEKLGWVERRPDPQDRRANRLHLTAAGRRKIDAVMPAHDAIVLSAMRGVSEADVKTFRKVLREIERAVGQAAEA
jgi:DNA-binding MarR family transcriptional regulator